MKEAELIGIIINIQREIEKIKDRLDELERVIHVPKRKMRKSLQEVQPY